MTVRLVLATVTLVALPIVLVYLTIDAKMRRGARVVMDIVIAVLLTTWFIYEVGLSR